MAGLRNNNNTQNAQWADYVGDILRGAQPINQLVPHLSTLILTTSHSLMS